MAKNKNFNWYNSSIMMLIIIFIITLPLAIYRLGIENVINQLLSWTIGSIFIAILIFVSKKVWGNK